MDELPFANRLSVFMPWRVEAVNPHLHRAVALHVVDLECPRNEFPRHLPQIFFLTLSVNFSLPSVTPP